MKGIRWLFGVCLGVLALCGATALDYSDTVRAASRSSAPKTVAGAQSRGTSTATKQTATSRANANTRDRTATATTTEGRTTKTVAPRINTRTNNVVPRTNVITRATTTTAATRRTATAGQPKSRVTTGATRTNRTARTALRAPRTIARATTGESGALIANYTGCRKIYYECMDEFCATKDTNLRRCACSSRVNEFNEIKNQMTKVEDQMLEFNQRLLLVNMDAEDAMAINTATEGEDAFFATKDTTKSKKALDDISKKLNETFGSSDSSVSLAPVNMSLNIDSAFDTIDSYAGADTTTKTGPALYNAATPVCREIATEVCNEEELALAISGYQMLMEQDCNTVYKSYQSQADAARTKVFESSALLDMSRLDAYQTRNADDMLTCKRKMLEMLTDSTVCGPDMQNCLDMTGKYIDPTTGAAFLTPSLPELGNLITRPTANQTWTSANSQSAFLTYLKNKKNYLSTAMENCQVIADSVWDAFIEDALAQIKLAQTAKLEEIRQACTTLTTTCLTSTAESIANFDTRALSIFGVAADKTTNATCTDIQTACATLIDGDGSGNTSWQTNMSNIATEKTYDTIVDSCTQVGRNCIVQACKSISGNFDLCDDIDLSANRHAILERTSCWPELLECVGAAGDDALLRIITLLSNPTTGQHKYAFYQDSEMYANANPNPIYDICTSECGSTGTDAECAKCRIAERIWGNCENNPSVVDNNNRILIPKSSQSTLLAWFAINTGTATIAGGTVTANPRSCINTRCASGQWLATPTQDKGMCKTSESVAGQAPITTNLFYCPTDLGIWMDVGNGISNCCYKGANNHGHYLIPDSSPVACCKTGNTIDGMCMPTNVTENKVLATGIGNTSKKIVCIGSSSLGGGGPTGSGFPSGNEVWCNGTFIIVDGATYSEPTRNAGTSTGITGVHYQPKTVYYDATNNEHEQTDSSKAGYISYTTNQ